MWRECPFATMGRIGAVLLFTWLLPATAAAGEHAVKAGDTLGRVASKHGCTLDEVRAANPGQGDLLQIGQKLKIPRCSSRPARTARVGKAEKRRKGKRAATPRKPKKIANGRHKLNSSTLPAAMRARGFRHPEKFKALVVELTLDKKHERVIRERPFDYKGTSSDAEWNPASTIKLFAAIGAMEYIASLGIGVGGRATFFDTKTKKRSYLIADLVEDTITKSDNIAYNRLVQLAGYDFLNGRTLTKRLGIVHGAIHRPYEKSAWLPLTGSDHFRKSPPILLTQGKKKVNIGARTGKGNYTCQYSAACASLQDLASAMRQLMLYEQIPKRERPRFGPRELRTVRLALMKDKKRGSELANAIKRSFPADSVLVFHKPGFAGDWMSDVAYVIKRRSRRRWIVAVAGYPGRESINSAVRAIAQVLANEDLEKEW